MVFQFTIVEILDYAMLVGLFGLFLVTCFFICCQRVADGAHTEIEMSSLAPPSVPAWPGTGDPSLGMPQGRQQRNVTSRSTTQD